MAHFAELDSDGYVTRVVVIDNAEIVGPDGTESEQAGADRCRQLFGGGRWVQTSYNGHFRGLFAGPGLYYDEELDEFV